MKKSSTPKTKKPVVSKRSPSTSTKLENNQDTITKVSPELTHIQHTRDNVKKIHPRSSQLTVSRNEKQNTGNAIKSKAPTNPKANLHQSAKLTKTPNTNHATKNPLTGNFNVTVFSPPSARKSSSKQQSPASTRDRTRTRTLKPEEVTVLKNIPKIVDDVGKEKPKPPPIAFDFQFGNIKLSSTKSAKKQITNNVAEAENVEFLYDSEFESYESDFESASSNKSSSSSASSDKSSSSNLSSKSTHTEGSSYSEKKHRQIKSINEQKLDSGNYDMKLKLPVDNDKNIIFGKSRKQDDNEPDSGVNSGMFETQIVLNTSKLLLKRYTDILDKISFNTMEFELYEEKPALYEYFVKNYCMIKGVQSQTQTETDANSCETQTENIHRRSCWVQYPAKFSIESINIMNTDPAKYPEEKLGTGHEHFHEEGTTSHHDDIFSDFLMNLESSKMKVFNNTRLPYISNCNFHDLCNFLNKSLHVIENVLMRNVENCDKPKRRRMQSTLQTISENSTVTAAHFDVNSHHVLLTIHECNVERAHHRCLVSVWDTRNFVKPKAILSCWSTVICTERIGTIVVAGTADGTLCLWNITENSEEVSPFQLISPESENENCHYGSVVAVRMANSGNNCRSIVSQQVLTLFESGVLVTWSISSSDQVCNADNGLNFNTTFHHAKLRLIQQHVLKLLAIQKRLVPYRLAVSNSFKKGSLEDLLISKNNATDDHTKDDLILANDMITCNNKAIILLNRQIIIVNYLEQKCALILKNQEFITNFKEHPKSKECIFMLASNNTIKIQRTSKHTSTASDHNELKVQNTKQHSSHFSSKFSPVLNKSCTIQNIVKNERKLYHATNSHVDGLAYPLRSNVDSNSPNIHHVQRDAEQLPFFHNQIFFLKPTNQMNSRLHFLSQGQLLCIGANRNATFINLNTGQESYLSDYVSTDSASNRLLGTTDKQVIMATDGREIYLYDI